MAEKVEIVIADDHALIRKGLLQVLNSQAHYTITEAENGKSALALIRKLKPDVAILDIEMPEMTGFEVAKIVHNEGLSLDIIFLTMYRDESVFNQAMDIGVKGYVLKENTVTEIIRCIETVLNGKHYLSPAISEFLIKRSTRLVAPAADKHGINLLTPSEKKILKLVASMRSNQEIADELNISVKTVHNHRNNISQKLGLHGTLELLKFATEHESQL